MMVRASYSPHVYHVVYLAQHSFAKHLEYSGLLSPIHIRIQIPLGFLGSTPYHVGQTER